MRNIEPTLTPGPASGPAVLSVLRGADGVWSVNEEGSEAAALSYFATKRAALRHAVQLARARRSCVLRILGSGGQVESSRSYADGDDAH